MIEMALKEKVSILVRSFFIQGAWNYMRFQNFGYLFVIKDHLRKIYSKNDDFIKAVLRHFEIFNTQPYMANLVIGNILKMEEQKLQDKEKKISEIKHSLACAYASIGDRLFWSRLRIVIFELTAFIFILFFAPVNSQKIIKIVAFSVFLPTVLYASFSLFIRWKGFEWGYQCGGKELCGLNFLDWNKIIKFFSMIAYVLVVFILCFLCFIFICLLVGEKLLNIFFSLLPILFAIFIQRYFRNKKRTLTYSIVAVVLFSFVINLLRNL